jgi:hypothetical protein
MVRAVRGTRADNGNDRLFIEYIGSLSDPFGHFGKDRMYIIW